MATVDTLEVARIIRQIAAEEILPRWRNLSREDVTTKSRSGDLVTVADHAAEVALTRRLEPLLPGSRVVGEEAVAAGASIVGHFLATDPVWVIDPIDGTRDFAGGGRVFDVMVGLVIGGEPVAGWIYAPADDTFYIGEVGTGARLYSGDREQAVIAPRGLALSDCEGILMPRGFASRGLPDPSSLDGMFRGFVRPTCAGHNYGRLLSGASQFLINFSTHPWDHYPGLAIAAAAGFHGARHDGAPFNPMDRLGGILVAPDTQSWEAIRDALLRPVPA